MYVIGQREGGERRCGRGDGRPGESLDENGKGILGMVRCKLVGVKPFPRCCWVTESGFFCLFFFWSKRCRRERAEGRGRLWRLRWEVLGTTKGPAD